MISNVNLEGYMIALGKSGSMFLFVFFIQQHSRILVLCWMTLGDCISVFRFPVKCMQEFLVEI